MNKKFTICLLCVTLMFLSGCSHHITANHQPTYMKMFSSEISGSTYDSIGQTTSIIADRVTLKDEIYALLDAYNVDPTEMYSASYVTPASYWYPEAYALLASYGMEAVPHILQYIIDHPVYGNDKGLQIYNQSMMLSVAYELVNVRGSCEIHWFNSTGRFSPAHRYILAQELLNHINENGLRPIYPFISVEEAAANQDKIIRQLDDTDIGFRWSLTKKYEDYQFDAALITDFGKYAVPYILDYILSHEGQPLTSDEEMHLGILLHLSYRMLGVETTANWHMPAEPVASTTDPFPYTHELIEHLGEYGLEEAPPQDITMT